MFITEYTSAVRLLYHKHYALIMTTVGAFFKKYLRLEKNYGKLLFLPSY